MDLGCIDLGCIDKHAPEETTGHSPGPDDQPIDTSGDNSSSASKIGKNKSSRGNDQSSPFNALTRFTSQIKMPSPRKCSPTNWFPRKKVDSYLKRKIQMLQETDGMNLTLDETLGDSSPHYSRVLKEKIAAREAATKAMEARKAALVEASWCRILRAARIQSKEAEASLRKAEETATEAFEAASALGVIMYDTPNCPKKQCQIETSTADGGRSTTHTVTASFETAFDVDKEVAAVVKTAFLRLASCPSFDRKEFRDLLRRTSQNPDIDELSEYSERKSESSSEADLASVKNDSGSGAKLPIQAMRLKKFRRKQSPEKLTKKKLADLMLERLKSLKDEELYSLASIVATCGLSAALAEVESNKLHTSGPTAVLTSGHSFKARRMSSASAGLELPSLDKFLVKHVSKLEKEVQEAKKAKRNDLREDNQKGMHDADTKPDGRTTSSSAVPDLGSILVKHSCKLEKEMEEDKKNAEKNFGSHSNKPNKGKQNSSEDIPDLSSMLIIHRSKLEKEVQEVKQNAVNHEKAGGGTHNGDSDSHGRTTSSSVVPDLGSILVDHSSKREKEFEEAKRDAEKNFGSRSYKPNLGKQDSSEEILDLGSILIIHQSKLEKEVQEAKQNAANHEKAGGLAEDMQRGMHNGDADSHGRTTSSSVVPDLRSILVNHSSKREKEFEEAKRDAEKNFGSRSYKPNLGKQDSSEEIPDLGSILTIHRSKLEKEVQEAKQNAANHEKAGGLGEDMQRGMHNGDADSHGRTTSSSAVPDLGYKPNLGKQDSSEEIPDLGSILTIHRFKLEKEVQEAKQNAANHEKAGGLGEDMQRGMHNGDADSHGRTTSSSAVPDLGSILVNHSSKLEKEFEDAKRNAEKNFGRRGNKPNLGKQNSSEEIPDLGSMIKHRSKLEEEVQEAKQNALKYGDMDNEEDGRLLNGAASKKKLKSEIQEVPGLEKVLVKHVSRLENEVQGARRNSMKTEQIVAGNKENVDLNNDNEGKQQDETKKRGRSAVAAAECEGLDKVLVKHVSRLEKEKMQLKLNGEELMTVKRRTRAAPLHADEAVGLDRVMVKHKSRLEREKMAAATGQVHGDQQVRPASSSSRRLAREREMQEAWGGLSLGNSIRPHLSKLEKDKAAWIKAEEEERRRRL